VIVGSPLTPLEDLLRSILDWLHGSVGFTWAWSIVALTLMVRLLLVPLMVKQIHSMQNLQRHAPQMKELQRKYKADKKRQQEELMKFYKENQINPAASCLPMLAQFPVFIALYLVLRKFAKHPPPGDLSWLHGFVPNIAAHASAHWSGYVLLALYVATQLVSTLWTVGQGLITRRLMPKAQAPAKRTSRTAPREEADQDGAVPEPAAAVVQPAQPAQPKRVKRKKKRGGARR